MLYKHLGLNKLTIGFLILICMMFVYQYLKVVHLRNALFIQDENNELDEYEDSEFNPYAMKSNSRRITEIKRIIKRRNDNQVVNNMYRETVVRKSTTVIVIEVRSNTFYLESLIESLKHVVGIARSLLIFSHEVYDEDINEIVRNITFARYIQIYFPFSVQTHPKVFPGADSKFCVYDFNCVNNDGRRNATAAQNKHHWWWRTSFIFDHLKVTKDFNGTVVFLEEDQCVAEDFIYILKLLEMLLPSNCPHCEIFSLGASNPNISQYHIVDATVVVQALGSTELLAIAFNRSVWNTMKNIGEHFCNYNDANWTRSLMYAANKLPSGQYQMLSIEGPRVFRISRCPNEEDECGELDKIEAVQTFMKKIKRGLFPRRVSIIMDNRHVNVSEGQGGWGDARDRELCMYFTRKPRFER